MVNCHQMSLSRDRASRLALLKEAEAVIDKLRELAAQHFSDRVTFIFKNLKGLEDAIRILAEMPLGFEEDNVCPVCGDPPTRITESRKCCLNCMEPIIDYRYQLASRYGFMTEGI